MDTTFTLSDASSKPYAWMLESVDMQYIHDATEYVEQYARMSINATNYSETSDADVYQQWRDESYEFEQAVAYVQSRIDEHTLEQVMTATEIAEEFELSESTVRQSINRNEFTGAFRKSAGTWLVLRKDALEKWGKRE